MVGAFEVEKSCGGLKLSTGDWLKIILLLAGHAITTFSAILVWTNRIVAVETRVSNIEQTIQQSVGELRTDIKEILKRLPNKP